MNDKVNHVKSMIKQTVFILAFLLTLSTNANADIVINEIMASNSGTISSDYLDPCGDHSDWIELYNTGGVAVNLQNWVLEDAGGGTYTIPSGQIIGAGQTMGEDGNWKVFWANDRDNCLTGDSLPFKISANGDTVILKNSDGDEVDRMTTLQAATDESYGRSQDGGSQLVRMPTPSIKASNISTQTPLVQNAQFVRINEVVSSNTNGHEAEDGKFYDWFELYNEHGSITVNLKGLRVADNSKQWVFPDVDIGPKQHLVVFASDKHPTQMNGGLHTNFEITAEGETLKLLNTDGTPTVDDFVVERIPPNTSWGRLDDVGQLANIQTPTPGEKNPSTPGGGGANPNADLIIINEINIANESGLRDYENDYNDWVEFYNTSPDKDISMDGLKISDGSKIWAFPANSGIEIKSQKYLVVFLSGDNGVFTNAQGKKEAHTNFSIKKNEGGTVIFMNSDAGNTIIEAVPVSPMAEDTSWGLSSNHDGAFRLWNSPTPDDANRNFNDYPSRAELTNIVINEVSNNNSTFLDSDGQKNDWIEIYNTSGGQVELEGLLFQDEQGTYWRFPQKLLGGLERLLIWASDKNRIEGNGEGNQEFHTNFGLALGGEQLKLLNADKTPIGGPIPIPALNPDESYGRTSDGAVSFQVFTNATPRDPNEDSSEDPLPEANQLVINELSSATTTGGHTDENNIPQDWIEIYNKGPLSVELKGLKLRDEKDVWTFPIPHTLGAGEFVLVFASNLNSDSQPYHTNFQINNEGEVIELLNRNNAPISTMPKEFLLPNQSFGSVSDGSQTRKKFDLPDTTPGFSNSGGDIAYGDVNNNGTINALDAALTAQHTVTFITLDPDAQVRADVSGDGRINALDAALIAQFTVTFIDKFPVEE